MQLRRSANSDQMRVFHAEKKRIPKPEDSLAERGGFEPPVPRGFYGREFGPSLAHYSGRQKSIRAGENLFALGFVFALALSGSLRSPRLNADARRRRRSDQSFRFKSERLVHRYPVSVAHCLDGADEADGAQSDDGDTACVLS
jgi:hypothetical protein